MQSKRSAESENIKNGSVLITVNNHLHSWRQRGKHWMPTWSAVASEFFWVSWSESEDSELSCGLLPDAPEQKISSCQNNSHNNNTLTTSAHLIGRRESQSRCCRLELASKIYKVASTFYWCNHCSKQNRICDNGAAGRIDCEMFSWLNFIFTIYICTSII